MSSLCMVKIVLIVADLFQLNVFASLCLKSGIGASAYILSSLILWKMAGKPEGVESLVFDMVTSKMAYKAA